MLVFGPVPSRRLGRSLGVNNIPKKVCSYDCVYCQVGKTKRLTIDRRSFFGVQRILEETEDKVKDFEFDYITFVPDGEPTLDRDLGEEIKALKRFEKVAVITNGSLLWREDVREDLLNADWVSVKVDAGDEKTWKLVNRPANGLSFSRVVDGIFEFSRIFKGYLVTETMLVKGFNDSNLDGIADIIEKISPEVAYVSVPTRPPAYDIKPPDEKAVDRAYVVLSSRGLKVHILSRPEVGDFVIGKDPKEGILSITAVHPMREDDLKKSIEDSGSDWKVVEDLLMEGKLEVLEYNGVRFYRKR